MSALPPKADKPGKARLVCFVPKADIERCSKTYPRGCRAGPERLVHPDRWKSGGRPDRAGVTVMLRLERVGAAAIRPTVPVVRPAHDHCAQCRRRTNRRAPPRASTNER